jgi:hypothetical protein
MVQLPVQTMAAVGERLKPRPPSRWKFPYISWTILHSGRSEQHHHYRKLGRHGVWPGFVHLKATGGGERGRTVRMLSR